MMPIPTLMIPSAIAPFDLNRSVTPLIRGGELHTLHARQKRYSQPLREEGRRFHSQVLIFGGNAQSHALILPLLLNYRSAWGQIRSQA